MDKMGKIDKIDRIDKKRNTVQRQLIFNAVKELDIHATAEQVYEYVVRKYPTVSKATVYRNLSQMAESGELLNIGSFYGSAHYDHVCREHYHFICENCRRVFDVDGEFSDIVERIEKPGEFDITGFYISFTGLCRKCKDLKL
jgi:Fe2+ or Zn2+ uptake regulation protein